MGPMEVINRSNMGVRYIACIGAAWALMACSSSVPEGPRVLHHVVVTLQSTSPSPALILVSRDSSDHECRDPAQTLEHPLAAKPKRSGLAEWKPLFFTYDHAEVPGIRLCIQQGGVRYLGTAYLRLPPERTNVSLLCILTSQSERIDPFLGDPPPEDSADACTLIDPSAAKSGENKKPKERKTKPRTSKARPSKQEP